MIEFDPSTLDRAEIYKLMTGAVVPRPIAWVTSCSASSVVNLAPFSSFTFVCHDPPMLAIGVDIKPDGGGRKDTSRNIHASREFVVHIADHSLLGALHASAAELPPEMSELDLYGLQTAGSTRVSTPRVALAPIALECVLERALTLGRESSELLIGRVVYAHVHPSVLRDGRIDATALDPVCRLGGPNYASLGRVTSKERI